MKTEIKNHHPLDYRVFLERKTHLGSQSGFSPLFMPDFLFPFQRALTTWAIWKEPLGVRLRTMAKGLAHAQIVEDSTLCDVASADYLLTFRKHGENKVPISHP